MAVFETGYRAWNERRVPAASRTITICSTGIRRAYKSKWLRRLMMATVIPLFYFALPFMFFEQSADNPALYRGAYEFITRMPQSQMLQDKVGHVSINPTAEDIQRIRHDVWAYLFLTLMRYPQAFLMIVAVGIVAPPLISQDLRTRAYLIYFSRPVTRAQYILGKFGTVGFFISLLCITPPLLLYAMGLMLTTDADQFLRSWDLPLRILCATIVVTIPTTLVALAISSLTLESRYAAFGWFALWIAGHIVYTVLYASMDFRHFERGMNMPDPGWRVITSPYQVLGIVQSSIFGFKVAARELMMSWSAIAITTALSLGILFRRVQAPMRA